ncbi:AAA domain-containing protein [Salinimonas lutimaris]|uniref:AAA domain-containing protein n=1 Tax=Salinimonas lutimaris TaxID=914153 RepID=UPI0010BF6D54|nr:AAA domain-containing protein [Salinimonas lutimaris]
MKKALSLNYNLLNGHPFGQLSSPLLKENDSLIREFDDWLADFDRLQSVKGFETNNEDLIKSLNNLKQSKDNADKNEKAENKTKALDTDRFVLAIDIKPEFNKNTITVMTIPVKIRNVSGQLNRFIFFPDHQSIPTINPDLLEVDGKIPVRCIGSAEQIDRFDFSTFRTDSDDLQAWYKTADDLLKRVSSLTIDNIETHKGLQLENPDVVITLRRIQSNDAANRNIINLYDEILTSSDDVLQQTSLAHADVAYVENELPGGIKWLSDDYLLTITEQRQKPFLAHMDECKGEDTQDYTHRELFALDNTQRGVASVAAYMRTGDVLAVNGPPGSGKTAMLKAVISHQYVEAALAQASCPIVVGVGGTNQSVTNIVNAFPGVLYKGNGKPLYHMRRWISGPDNYGTYFPSLAAKESMPDGAVLGEIDKNNKGGVVRWSDALSKLNDPTQLDSLIKEYLTHAQVHFGESFTTVDDVVSKLHSTLTELATTVESLYRSLIRAFDENFAIPPQEHADFAQYFDNNTFNPQGAKLIEMLYELAQGGLERKHEIYSDVCREYIRDNQLEDDPQALARNDIQLTNIAKIIIADRAVDLLVRSELFHFAARYWEGRYLASCDSQLLIYASPSNLELGLRRMCMLTPILVSTVQSAPKLFAYAKPPGLSGTPYLLGKADLLIIDEAGQADIRTTLPLLGLSRKTIAVGDIAQIPPVITDASPIIEQGLYHTLGMGANKAHTHKCFVHAFKNKLLPSLSGSILHVLREISFYNHQEKGMSLRGHYRCQETLSQFCNELVYDNKIFIIPPLFKEKGPYPPLSWVSSAHKTQKVGTSHKNKREALDIVNWIIEQWPQIYDHYNTTPNEPAKNINDLIGIISPYKAQSLEFIGRTENDLNGMGTKRGLLHTKLIDAFAGTRYAISKNDIDKMKVGTVNALQGAEKPIILFSGTKSVQHGGDIHYRSDTYILNVAVSRAKECFIAFLCEKTFGIPTNREAIAPPRDPNSDSVGYLGYYIGKRGQRLYPRSVVIIESDNKIEALQRHLGNRYVVVSTKGKLFNLGMNDEHAVSIKDGLFPQYQFLIRKSGKRHTSDNGKIARQAVDDILNACSGADIDEIILATDDDFVGEHIAWHLRAIFNHHQPQNLSKLHRVRLRGLTKQSITRAFGLDNSPYDNKKNVNLNVASAEMVREILDLLLARKLTSLAQKMKAEKASDDETLALDKHLIADCQQDSVHGMGRVKAAILSLVYDHLRAQLQSISHPTGAPVNVKIGNKTIKGRLIQQKNVKNINTLSKTLKAVMENGQAMMTPGAIWKVTKAIFDERSVAAPDASTLKVMRENALKADIPPTDTYRALTSLYEGKNL